MISSAMFVVDSYCDSDFGKCQTNLLTVFVILETVIFEWYNVEGNLKYM